MNADQGFSGVIAPVLTPFGPDGAPDGERLAAHAHWLLADGCTGLAPFGTTSEANSLGLGERMQLLEELAAAGLDCARLMPGTGTTSITDTVSLTKHAVSTGCGAVLMLPPYYYKAIDDEGLFAYFARVIDGVGDDRLKVFLYHIPPVAQVGFSLDLVIRLHNAFPGIVIGLKDSSGDWNNTKAHIEALPDFRVFSGSEVTLLDNLKAGGAGCISATANINARGLRAIYDAFLSGVDAEPLQDRASELRLAIQQHPMVPILKAMLAVQNDDAAWLDTRPPLVQLDAGIGRETAAQLLQHRDSASRK